MGFGLPAAIGAQLARPYETVIAIVGDGGFQMTMNELATANIHGLPLKVLILDNQCLGMVRQWQEMFYENRESSICLQGSPNFLRLGEAYGIRGFHITEREDMQETLREAFVYDQGPCLIHAEVFRENNVYPMIPAGKSASEIILDPRKRGTQ